MFFKNKNNKHNNNNIELMKKNSALSNFVSFLDTYALCIMFNIRYYNFCLVFFYLFI